MHAPDRQGIGLFGGTFDPVHKGHLKVAQGLLEACNTLSQIRFIPCYQPVHRPPPVATPQQRLSMLELAVSPHKQLRVEDWEIQQAGPSYSIDTVTMMRQQYPQTPLYLIVGMDAFRSFCQWKSWQALLQSVHIVVMSRSDSPPLENPELKRLLSIHQVHDTQALTKTPAGAIWCSNIPTLPISSTHIRQHLHTQDSDPEGLTPEVLQYMRTYNLYRF